MMETQPQTREPQMGLTFEKVWAALMESREIAEKEMRESREKSEREMQELRESLRESRERSERELLELRESLLESRERSEEKYEREMRESREKSETGLRELRESRERAERELLESRKIAEEKAEKEMQKLQETMRETSRIVGGLGNKFGELADHLVAPNIAEKFNALGYNFTYVTNRTKFRDNENKKIMAEVDVLLNNRDFVMAVEVKAQPTEEHVRDHIQRMEILRRYADAHEDGRKYIGAIAGAIMNEQVKRYAVKSGFYVIEQSGDTVKIDAPEGFKPKEW